MAKKPKSRFDAAGWVFFVIVMVVLAAPAIYGMWRVSRAGTSPLVWLGAGSITAALGAGFISWAVNGMLQYRRKRQRIAERKIGKRRK